MPTLRNAQKAPGRRMHALETGRCDAHHLAELNPRLLVAGDDVRLNHDRHVGFEPHLRHWTSRTAFGAEHRRPVTAAKAVHDVIVDGETRVLDDAGRINNLLT